MNDGHGDGANLFSSVGNKDAVIGDIQRYLAEHDLDGWLIYDYHGLNPLSGLFLGSTPNLATRRWLYFVPRSGGPVYLFQRIEDNLPRSFPGQVRIYTGWLDFYRQIECILSGCRRIALEYSPRCALPSVSRVDAGTVEVLRELGIEPVSSAELVQFIRCRLDQQQVDSHRAAVEGLYAVKDIIIEGIRNDLRAGFSPSEYQVQQRYLVQFERLGLITEHPPIVAVNEHSGNPHYQPEPDASLSLKPDSLLMLDTWARKREAGSVYADITWMVYLGESVPERIEQIFEIVRAARDAVVEGLVHRHRTGQSVRGYEADDMARGIITAAGFGEYFTHRTGHNLSSDVHGAGANLDNLETHEERLLIPGTAFTVEPGIYLPEFGVRSEIDLYYDPAAGFQVTTPAQKEITRLQI